MKDEGFARSFLFGDPLLPSLDLSRASSLRLWQLDPESRGHGHLIRKLAAAMDAEVELELTAIAEKKPQ
ncbi:hypothetical protein NL676_035412 [Syzygium grande]|nr:hypothetical protein NL676_035412 [Syzygium grande]